MGSAVGSGAGGRETGGALTASGNYVLDGIEHTWTTTRRDGRPVGVLALHAGLEGGTGELAEWLAEELNLTCFVVYQPSLECAHISSARMGAAPWAALHDFLERHEHIVSIHGYHDLSPLAPVVVGGAVKSLRRSFARYMSVGDTTLTVVDGVDVGRFAGTAATNPVNLVRRGGIQVEVPASARGAIPGGARGAPCIPSDELKAALRAATNSLSHADNG